MGIPPPDPSSFESPSGLCPTATVPWSIGDTIRATLAVVIALVITIVLAIVAKGQGEGYVIAASSVFPICVLAITLQFSIRKYHCPWSTLGFSRVSPKKHVLLVFVGLIAALSTITIYSLAVNALDLEIPEGLEFLDEGLWVRIPGIFLVIIAAPIIEEVFFRGFIFGGLNRQIGLFAGALLSAALFAILHLHPMVYAPIFIIGLILAWVYARSGSLWTSIQLHMAYNATVIGVNL